MNPGRWRLPGEYMHYGALTRLWLTSDDGIVARIPDTDGKLPDAAIFLFEPEKLLQIVREAVGQLGTFRRPFSRMRRAGIINAGPHAGPSHPALATTAARQSVAGNRCRDIQIFRSFSKPYANVCKMFMIFPRWNV